MSTHYDRLSPITENDKVWLISIDETYPAVVGEVFEKYPRDPTALANFIKRSLE